MTRNDVIMMSLPKTIEAEWEGADLTGTNKIYIVRKVLIRAIQPYLDWAFCQPKKTGEGKMALPANLAISSQMTMKLGKDMLWLQIAKNFYDVIFMLIL